MEDGKAWASLEMKDTSEMKNVSVSGGLISPLMGHKIKSSMNLKTKESGKISKLEWTKWWWWGV